MEHTHAMSTLGHDADDATVVAMVLAGEQESYALLVERHHHRVRGVVARMLGSRAECDEVVQDVFVAAYQDLADFDIRLPLPAWLCGIARNQVLMRLRRQQRSNRLLEAYRVHALHELEVEPPDHDDRLQLAMRDCQAALAPLAARAVELRYRGGLELAEVAAQLGRSVVATRQLLYRIRGQLRACLAQQGIESP